MDNPTNKGFLVNAKVKIAAISTLVILASIGVWTIKGTTITDNLGTTITDDLGRKVTISGTPERIVSLAPSCTEILFALGLGDKVVGVTTYCDYPPEATQKEKVGGFSTINVEQVVALNPDLVLARGGVQETFVKQLEGLGITVVALDPDNLDGILHDIALVGDITGVRDVADTLTENLRQRIENVTNKTENAGKPKVFYVVWDEPLMTCGQGTFQDALITLAGGTNLGAAASGEWPTYSLEVLVAEEPDVIVIGLSGKPAESMVTPSGWNNLSAVQSGRVYEIDDKIAGRPGPRIVDALENMVKYIHPELFG